MERHEGWGAGNCIRSIKGKYYKLSLFLTGMLNIAKLTIMQLIALILKHTRQIKSHHAREYHNHLSCLADLIFTVFSSRHKAPEPNCSFGASLNLGKLSSKLTTLLSYQICRTGLKDSGIASVK